MFYYIKNKREAIIATLLFSIASVINIYGFSIFVISTGIIDTDFKFVMISFIVFWVIVHLILLAAFIRSNSIALRLIKVLCVFSALGAISSIQFGSQSLILGIITCITFTTCFILIISSKEVKEHFSQNSYLAGNEKKDRLRGQPRKGRQG